MVAKFLLVKVVLRVDLSTENELSPARISKESPSCN
jgi:hypothetical protein